jgi:hypothetical protein
MSSSTAKMYKEGYKIRGHDDNESFRLIYQYADGEYALPSEKEWVYANESELATYNITSKDLDEYRKKKLCTAPFTYTLTSSFSNVKASINAVDKALAELHTIAESLEELSLEAESLIKETDEDGCKHVDSVAVDSSVLDNSGTSSNNST